MTTVLGVHSTLAELTWTPRTRNHALGAWWSAEHARTPNLEDFLQRRKAIISAIPDPASWWRVGPIGWRDLQHMHAISTFAAGGVSNILGLGLHALRHGIDWPARERGHWGGILLFGHSRTGRFTVLEGNHRLIAAAVHGAEKSFMPADLHVNVVLSPSPCKWHFPG